MEWNSVKHYSHFTYYKSAMSVCLSGDASVTREVGCDCIWWKKFEIFFSTRFKSLRDCWLVPRDAGDFLVVI